MSGSGQPLAWLTPPASLEVVTPLAVTRRGCWSFLASKGISKHGIDLHQIPLRESDRGNRFAWREYAPLLERISSVLRVLVA